MHQSRRCQAFTLAEMMVSASVGALILGVVVAATASFGTVFNASDEYYKATSEQMRVLDYIALDLRRATSGTVSNNGQTLTLKLRDYLDYTQNPPVPRTAAITSLGVVSYGTSGATPNVVYTVTGTSPNQTFTRLTPRYRER